MKKLGIGNWELRMGKWELRIRPNPQSPITNPQSPIPNPQYLWFNNIIIKNNIFNVIKKYDNVIDVNLENKQKENSLFLAVNKNDINIVKELNINNFNTNNVTDFKCMFFRCSNELIMKIRTQNKNIKEEAFLQK